MTDLKQAIETLEYLKEDPMTIKRVKDKAEQIIVLLQQDTNLDKALRELEELGSTELPSYDRSLLWDAISVLESLSLTQVF